MELKNIKAPEELLGPDFADGPYQFNNFIQLDTFRGRRAARKKLKLLQIVHPAVSSVLLPDETVFYLTKGLRVSTLEQFFIGWATYYYNLAAFVFTSRRILLVHLKNNRARGKYISSIEYADIRKVSNSFLGNFIVKFVNGRSLLFTKVPRQDRRYLKGFLNSVLSENVIKDKEARGIRKLCPRCFQEIEIFPDACPDCELGFKSSWQAALLSLLMPGLGDMYLGSRLLGAIELLFMGMVWFSVLSMNLEPTAAGGDAGPGLITAAFAFFFFHPADALKSHYLTRKGLTPRQAVRYAGE